MSRLSKVVVWTNRLIKMILRICYSNDFPSKQQNCHSNLSPLDYNISLACTGTNANYNT